MKKREGSPSNNIEKKITDAQWRELLKKANQYRERVEKEGEGASKSYRHIMGNFAGICIVFEDYGPDEKTDEIYAEGLEVINYMERYFKLLDDFPEFAKKELEGGGGYFPEMFKKLGGSKDFVDAYEAELRKV